MKEYKYLTYKEVLLNEVLDYLLLTEWSSYQDHLRELEKIKGNGKVIKEYRYTTDHMYMKAAILKDIIFRGK